MSIDLLEGLPVTLTILRPPTAVRSRDEQYQWSELLYDLLAHSDPLSDLGVQLTYSRVKLADGSATAEIDLTDGIHESRTWLRLSQVGYGIADDLAMEFLDRFKSQSQGRD